MLLSRMAAELKDPLDWTVEEVVKFLCDPNHTPWSQSLSATPRPNPLTFAVTLRENQITGEVLLHDVTNGTLRDDLGLKLLGHRSGVLMAVRYLQRRSKKYMDSLIAKSRLEDDPSAYPTAHLPGNPIPSTHPGTGTIHFGAMQYSLPQNPVSLSNPETRPYSVSNVCTDAVSRPLPRQKSVSFEDPKTQEDEPNSSSEAVTPTIHFQGPSPKSQVEGPVEILAQRPKFRTQEQQVLDESGKKRRRLDLSSLESLKPPSDMLVLGAADNKNWYLGPNKLSASQLFYPVNPNKEEEHSFAMVGARVPDGQRKFVNTSLKYFYNHAPVLLNDDQVAVVPYKRSNVAPNETRYFTLFSDKQGKVAVSQEDTQRWPQLRDQPLHGKEFEVVDLEPSDPLWAILERYPHTESEAKSYPPYGDSGSEVDYDDETWQEYQTEQRQTPQSQKLLTSDQITSTIAEYIKQMEEKWRLRQLPKEESTAWRLWTQSRANNTKGVHIKDINNDIAFLRKRLMKYDKALHGNQYTNIAELRFSCQSMDQTIFDIQSQKWRLSLLENSICPPKPVVPPKAKSVKRPRRVQPDEESLDSDSDNGRGEFDDFIDDTALEESSWPDSMETAHHAGGQDVEMTQDQDIIMSTTSEGGPNTAPSSAMNNRQNPVAQTAFLDAPSPDGDALMPDADQTVTRPVVDLTADSPAQYSVDLSVHTPPTNEMQDVNMSQAPDLENQATVGDPMSGEEAQKILPDDPLTSIMRIPWESLEQRQDRQRLLMKLISTLPDDNRTRLIEVIPSYETSKLKALVTRALVNMMSQNTQDEEIGEPNFQVILRTAYLYISWVNCTRLSESEIPKNYLRNALNDALDNLAPGAPTNAPSQDQGFEAFSNELFRSLENYQKWVDEREAQRVLKEEDDFAPEHLNTEGLKGTSRKGRKQKVEQRKEVKNDQLLAQLRMVEQNRKRELLLKRMEGSGNSGHDPAQQAVTFGDPIIYLHPSLGQWIKPHQLQGIQFMWRELIQDTKQQGCLLAHTMGLGKTMQVISLLITIALAASSDSEEIREQVPESLRKSKTLILCPPSLIENWYEEFIKWTPPELHGILGPIRKIKTIDKKDTRIQEIFDWADEGGVLIMGYEMFRTWANHPDKDVSASLLDDPKIIVADEAHKIKNPASSLSVAVSKLLSKSRIALTGSPLANNLMDYYRMVDWIAPGYLGTAREFRAGYVEPIEEGLYMDSTAQEKRLSLRKLQVIKTILGPKISRADISVLQGSLPPKVEFVITVPLTEIQKEAYNNYLTSVNENQDASATTIWAWLANLSLCCNHPSCLWDKLLRIAREQGNISEGEDSSDSSEEPKQRERVWPLLMEMQRKIFGDLSDTKAPELSNRVEILKQIIAETIRVGDKMLIFSHSIPTLDFLECLLKASGWAYCRLDGKTPPHARQLATKGFNEAQSEQRIFLISTRAGGLGLNIPGANRVVIFDFGFNPTWEEQAVGRAYRLGQKRPVFVYRFLAGGTFETKVHNKAIFKTQLAYRVVDQKNPERHAMKTNREYLAYVTDVEQHDLSEYMGKDPEVLDKILSGPLKDKIRKIELTETFKQEDNDMLTEEETQAVQREVDDELKRRNPVPFGSVDKQNSTTTATVPPTSMAPTSIPR
ncbi:hypothetical protein ASPZODRAFT_111102, partial [Penicilliopsis zonata CBS 506.65]